MEVFALATLSANYLFRESTRILRTHEHRQPKWIDHPVAASSGKD